MPRPPAKPPRGRVTIQETADLAGLGYQRVYTLVTSGEVPSERDESGGWTIARRDAAQIKRREPADTNRKAVMLRVPLERYAAWERAPRPRAPGDQPVSTWLGELADAAAKRGR